MSIFEGIDEEKDDGNESRVPVASLVTEQGIAEEVWDRQTVPQFAFRRFGGTSIDLVNKVETDEMDESGRSITYVPADGPALRKGLVLVPREPKTGTFEEAYERGRLLAHEVYDVSNGHAAEFDFLVAVAQASWFLDRFIPDAAVNVAGMGRFAPIISLRGPSGHGKNRALSALRLNAYRPFYDQSTKRVPSLFRPLDLWRGTLCIDECDLGKSDESADVVHYLNCRAYGTPISRQNPDSPRESQAFYNFGLTIDTQRRPWMDDALENRTLPFNCERSQKGLPTTELDDWLTRGLDIQDRLLYLRLTNWENVIIDKNARLQGIKDHRLTAAVLPVLALRGLASGMVSNLEEILKVLARRRQEVRAASVDGLIVNQLWERLDAGLIGSWNGRLFVGGEKIKDDKSEETVTYPLSTSEVADILKWRSSEVRRLISSLQITPDDAPRHAIRLGSRAGLRPIFFNPAKLEVLLADFVVDYEGGTLARRLDEAPELVGVRLTDYSRAEGGLTATSATQERAVPENVADVAEVAANTPLSPSEIPTPPRGAGTATTATSATNSDGGPKS